MMYRILILITAVKCVCKVVISLNDPKVLIYQLQQLITLYLYWQKRVAAQLTNGSILFPSVIRNMICFDFGALAIEHHSE